ncbi:MAG: hypothetical protein QM765_06615 [Myxococcales bacterium]
MQRLLRIPPRRAGWAFVVHACLFVGFAGLIAFGIHLDEHDFHASPALALGAVTFLVLPRFNRWSGWLYPFQAFATAAVALLVPAPFVTFVVAAFAFAPLALALLSKSRPVLGNAISGVEIKQLAEPIGILALLQALAGAIACFAVGTEEIAPLSSLAPATAALALFFILFPLLDSGSIWLALAGLASWVTVAVLLPFELTALSLAAFSTILVGIGALLALRWDRHGRVLATTGLGLAACAIAAFWYGWPAASVANAETMFAMVTLTLVVAPRVFESPVFLPLAVAAGAFSLSLAAPTSDRTLWMAALSVGVATVAVSLRRFPRLSVVLFGLEKHFGALTLLAASACLLSFAAAGLGVFWDGQHLTLAGALGLAAATFFLAFLAIEEPWLAAGAGVLGVAALASLDVRPELAFLLAQAGVNALFLVAGALAWAPTRGLLDKLYDLFSPAGSPRGIPKPTEKALAATASFLAFLGLLVLCFLSIWRIFAFGPLGVFESAWAPWMAGAQVVTALHQLRRRPMLASWHGLLVAILAALWLLFSVPLWNYVAGVWALTLVVLAWLTRSPTGRKAVDILSPGLDDAQVENLRKTLSAYSTATALLGLQALHPNKLEAPVSWALLTATFGLQAVLGSGFGRVMFLIAVPFTVHYAAFFVGIKLDTGRPQEVILPYLAASMAVVALLSERTGAWRKARGHGGAGLLAAHLYGALAAVEWGCGVALVHYSSAEVAACFVAGASLTLLWTLRALAEDHRGFAWLAELLLPERLRLAAPADRLARPARPAQRPGRHRHAGPRRAVRRPAHRGQEAPGPRLPPADTLRGAGDAGAQRALDGARGQLRQRPAAGGRGDAADRAVLGRRARQALGRAGRHRLQPGAGHGLAHPRHRRRRGHAVLRHPRRLHADRPDLPLRRVAGGRLEGAAALPRRAGHLPRERAPGADLRRAALPVVGGRAVRAGDRRRHRLPGPGLPVPGHRLLGRLGGDQLDPLRPARPPRRRGLPDRPGAGDHRRHGVLHLAP